MPDACTDLGARSCQRPCSRGSFHPRGSGRIHCSIGDDARTDRCSANRRGDDIPSDDDVGDGGDDDEEGTDHSHRSDDVGVEGSTTSSSTCRGQGRSQGHTEDDGVADNGENRVEDDEGDIPNAS